MPSQQQQHFNVTYRKLTYCFPRESMFVQTKLLKVSEPGIQEISLRRHIFPQTLFTQFIHMGNPHWIHKQQAGGALFCSSKMRKKKIVCPSINKSNERHPLVHYSQSAILFYYLSPQAGLSMRRKLSCMFFALNVANVSVVHSQASIVVCAMQRSWASRRSEFASNFVYPDPHLKIYI